MYLYIILTYILVLPSYHNQNYSDYRSASVISIYVLGYEISNCNLIDFGHDKMRMDQD